MSPPILRQKLTPPRPWAGVIPRPRLEAWLDAAFERGAHVGVFAATGYGKTALLAAWAQRHGAAWLTLDAEDADLDVALTYLITAFENALPGFRTEARDLLGRARERDGAFATLSALLADLDEQCDRPLALVIDDYHLAASPSLDALVARMLRYLPPTIRLVLASRKPPDVELAMLQARGSLEVLDERGLAFDLAELGELRPGVEPQGLMSATGGWPAAMGLTPELLDAFLEEQLLASLPADVRAFMQRVAVVETFDAALCEEALGEPFTRERRDYLVRERLIFNRGAERFALQPAVRNLLARRFQAEVPRDERQGLLRRVGDHFWRTGQASTALRYWGEAGEGDLAAEHLRQVADTWLAAGRLDALANAIAQLGPAAERADFLFYAAELHRRWGD
ncbi:MAG: ATP-dependent transcriptional regulator, MalT-like, LuxR family, partial [Cyanobacteria bacterium RYN_339]|nr:ATP-dependent transcriptional regulator, MalT-like, LuxR family [Cyanobacteria bacterium RYN_339]